MKLFADIYRKPTTQTDQLVSIANQHIARMYSRRKNVGEGFLHALAVFLSDVNIEQKSGGPFGAVIVKFSGGLDSNGQGIGRPTIIGLGANHVVPNNDPSAHAEMEAYRDATKRQGYSDLSGAVLYTSCECCPMCLSVANGSGISRISYVNTRNQAAEIEFSDQLQYELFNLPLCEQMTLVTKLAPAKQAELTSKLGAHSAVILDDKGEVFAYGDATTEKDPTGIASINAIKSAVKKHADIEALAGNPEPIFSLPEGYTLVTRSIPHPAGWVTADWARLLRKPDPQNPNNPAFDSKTSNPLRIIHLTNKYEQIAVSDKNGNMLIHQDAKETYLQPTLPDEKRLVKTQKYFKAVVPQAAQDVFNNWIAGKNQGRQIGY